MMLGLSLGAIVFGGGLGVFEDLGFEELFVGLLGIVEGVGALGMELQGRLEQFQCVVDLRETSAHEAEDGGSSQPHLELLERIGFILDILLGLDVDRLEGRRLVVARSAWEGKAR